MKSVLKDNSARARHNYPKLMQSKTTGAVVLFTGPGEGVVVHLGTAFGLSVGHSSGTFWESNFSDFPGTVELSNE